MNWDKRGAISIFSRSSRFERSKPRDLRILVDFYLVVFLALLLLHIISPIPTAHSEKHLPFMIFVMVGMAARMLVSGWVWFISRSPDKEWWRKIGVETKRPIGERILGPRPEDYMIPPHPVLRRLPEWFMPSQLGLMMLIMGLIQLSRYGPDVPTAYAPIGFGYCFLVDWRWPRVIRSKYTLIYLAAGIVSGLWI